VFGNVSISIEIRSIYRIKTLLGYKFSLIQSRDIYERWKTLYIIDIDYESFLCFSNEHEKEC
jgi:hypothetical protein